MANTKKIGSTFFEEDRKEYEVPVDTLNEENKTIEVCVQGEMFTLPRGKTVSVNPIVKEIINETSRLNAKVNTSNDKLVVQD